MNFISKIISGGKNPSQSESQQQPPPPSQSDDAQNAAPAPTATDNSSASSNAAPLTDPCSGCSDPCDVHANYPAYLKIDRGDMSASVKPHRRHVLVAQGKRFNEWIDEVTDEQYEFIHRMDREIERNKDKINYGVRVGAVDLDRLNAADYENDRADGIDAREQFADVYLFPDHLVFPRLSINSIADFVRAIFIEDRGRFKMRENEEQRKIQKEKAKNRAKTKTAATTSETNDNETNHSNEYGDNKTDGSDSDHLDLEFDHHDITGVALLICAHKKRDKRCGVTGPILEREFCSRSEALKEINRAHSFAPIKTFLISHIGGHKYAGNVIVYPPGLWLGRVKPCHVDAIITAFAQIDENEDTKKAREDLAVLRRGELEW